MSTIDLFILGSLCQSPKSAYDLQKQIEARNLSRWIKLVHLRFTKNWFNMKQRDMLLVKPLRTEICPKKHCIQ